ncbi:major facilitator superfamily domain-containing protein [Massariosphaeria phaeospora]|uniref:Major facilitator superfamily domain-containing protein n=1 Tax=Massariosphaeria phaeospora TaxID=100035 RepID=A0A7C8MAL3_9PLEO|nr:major facilitator superfamily domain-containing protein [Massariosphaeria phaeospora]
MKTVSESAARNPLMEIQVVTSVDVEITDRPTAKDNPGVRRIEEVHSHITSRMRASLFAALFLICFAYELCQILRHRVPGIFGEEHGKEHGKEQDDEHDNEHPRARKQSREIEIAAVVATVLGAAAHAAIAKTSDVVGRFETIIVSVILFTLGSVLQAAIVTAGGYAAGTLLVTLGYVAIQLVAYILIADVTSLRNRLIFSIIPMFPFLFIPWIRDAVEKSFPNLHIDRFQHQWAHGMWAIIYPICATPLLLVLHLSQRQITQRRAPRQHAVRRTFSRRHILSRGFQDARRLFWQLDIAGSIFIFGAIALLTYALTIGKQNPKEFRTVQLLFSLITGVLCIPCFIIWERKAPYPLLPYRLLKDRAVWGALCVSFSLQMAEHMLKTDLNRVLEWRLGDSVEAAMSMTNISSATFIVALLAGVYVRSVRRLKTCIVFGAFIYMAGFIPLFIFLTRKRYASLDGLASVVIFQILLATGRGMIQLPAMVSIQAATASDNQAVVTSLYLAMGQLGIAFGEVFTAGFSTHFIETLCKSPTIHSICPIGGIDHLYLHFHHFSNDDRQKAMTMVMLKQRWVSGVAGMMSILVFMFAMSLRDPELGDKQSLITRELPQAFELQGNTQAPERGRSRAARQNPSHDHVSSTGPTLHDNQLQTKVQSRDSSLRPPTGVHTPRHGRALTPLDSPSSEIKFARSSAERAQACIDWA